jgi:hypothetical protein
LAIIIEEEGGYITYSVLLSWAPIAYSRGLPDPSPLLSASAAPRRLEAKPR